MVDKRVLVIDDDEDIRFTIMEICRSQQWIAREAADYQEAQTVMKEFSPDVILVDYHMPVHDGIWMTREIRKTDRNTSIIPFPIKKLCWRSSPHGRALQTLSISQTMALAAPALTAPDFWQ